MPPLCYNKRGFCIREAKTLESLESLAPMDMALAVPRRGGELSKRQSDKTADKTRRMLFRIGTFVIYILKPSGQPEEQRFIERANCFCDVA